MRPRGVTLGSRLPPELVHIARIEVDVGITWGLVSQADFKVQDGNLVPKTLFELTPCRVASGSQGRGRRGEALPDSGKRVSDVEVGEEREPRLLELVIQQDSEVRAGTGRVVDRAIREDAGARGGHVEWLADRAIQPGVGHSHAGAPFHGPVRPLSILAAGVVHVCVVHAEMARASEIAGRPTERSRPVRVVASIRDGELAEPRRQPIAQLEPRSNSPVEL